MGEDVVDPSGGSSFRLQEITQEDYDWIIAERERKRGRGIMGLLQRVFGGGDLASRVVNVNVIGLRGNSQSKLTIEKDLNEETYRKFQHNGELYRMDTFVDGKQKSALLTYDVWLQAKAVMDSIPKARTVEDIRAQMLEDWSKDPD